MVTVLRPGLLFICLAGFACEDPIPLPVPPVEQPLPPDAELLASRPFRVFTPSGYDGGTPLPLLLALHGYGNTGGGLDEQFDLERLAESRGFLLVAPNATQDARGFRSWRPHPFAKAPFDREYLHALLQKVKLTHAVDPARVFVFGFSQGGHMAHRVGCDAADEIAALVSVAGQAATDPADCLPARNISALQVHGTLDEAIHYDGDVTEPISPNVPSAHQTIAVWGRVNGCGALEPTSRVLDLSTSVDGGETTVERYVDCPQGFDVELWTMNGVSHWPSPRPNFMGVLYGFLLSHPRPQ